MAPHPTALSSPQGRPRPIARAVLGGLCACLVAFQADVPLARHGLAYAAAAPVASARLEQDMLALVNRERRRRGLVPLRWDGRLADLARAHSRDMLARNYFAHEDPEGKSATDRAAEAGVTYRMLGENLAFAPTLRLAHQGLMKSPGHRENLLRPQFRRLGIGMVRVPPGADYHPDGPNGKYGGYLLVTQVFAS